MYTREIVEALDVPPEAAASMGPGFVHPGNTRARRPGARAARFNGARVCTPGKSTRTSPPTWGPGRFNGARVCTPGKLQQVEQHAHPLLVASMGPGFVHPGNPGCGVELETLARASMGPGFVHPGNPPTGRRCGTRGSAGFNGARVCTPGKSHAPRHPQPAQWSFNGARVCTAGKCGQLVTISTAGSDELQWGPGLYTREIRCRAERRRGSPSFNGARVCTPGKLGAMRIDEVRERELQWGPGLYTREIPNSHMLGIAIRP